MTQTPETTQQLMARLLDRGYTQAAQQTLNAIGRFSQSGLMAQRLDELAAEAQRLQAAGLSLTADNAVLRATLADFDLMLQRDAALIRAAGDALQGSAADAAGVITQRFALAGLPPSTLAQMGVRWNVPDPEAIKAVVDYTARPAFDTLITQYVSGIGQTVGQAALRGILAGQNPVTTARDVRDLVQGLPGYQANAIMRTLQLTAYRDATALHQAANADIIEGVMWVAALDDRTCMSCVAMHGTMLGVGERVDDHWNGRCVGVSVVVGRDLNVPPGEDWFNARSEEQQRAQMGDAAYEAWKSGAITLQDFVHRHDDPLFGSMIQEASLKGMLGDTAKQFYQRN